MTTTPLQIHLGEVTDSARIDRTSRRPTRLERYSDEIQRCQVWVEAPHGHHRQGRLYDVRIRLTVPDEELVVHDQPRDDDVQSLVHRLRRRAPPAPGLHAAAPARRRPAFAARRKPGREAWDADQVELSNAGGRPPCAPRRSAI